MYYCWIFLAKVIACTNIRFDNNNNSNNNDDNNNNNNNIPKIGKY